jgi:hypothetical protein
LGGSPSGVKVGARKAAHESSASRVAAIVIVKDSAGRSVQIVELSVPDAPQECQKRASGERERQRNEQPDDGHARSEAGSRERVGSEASAGFAGASNERWATVLTTMVSDESGIKIAASSG